MISSYEFNMINESTIVWQKPPQDLRDPYKKLYIAVHCGRMHLDDISFEDDRVLTGVQFYKVRNNIRTAIYGREGREGKRSRIEGTEPHSIQKFIKGKIPGFQPHSSTYTKTFNTTVFFEQSSVKYDYGQSVMPYFGTVEISTFPPQILQGIGFMHITNQNTYGGVIVPFVRTINHHLLKP